MGFRDTVRDDVQQAGEDWDSVNEEKKIEIGGDSPSYPIDGTTWDICSKEYLKPDTNRN